METCRVLTVDDEVLALRRLKLVLQNFPGIEHVGEATSCEEALAKIRETRPDILLLDVKMRDGTGFDILDQLDREAMPQVIFVSAFSHFAVRAFASPAVDYVLKPVESGRLAQALDRAQRRIISDDAEQRVAELHQIIMNLRASFEHNAASPFEREFWIRENVTGFVRVPVDAIEWVTSEDDYVRLHTRDRSYLLRSSIRKFEERVDPDQFVRIHRQALVRVSAIREVRNPSFGRQEVILYNNERLRVGRVYAKRFRDALLRQPVPAPPVRPNACHSAPRAVA